MTLRGRLTAVLVAVVVVPLVVGTAVLAVALPRAFDGQQARGATSSAALAAEVVAGLCERARAAAEAGGRAVLAVPADPAAERQALAPVLERGLADGMRVSAAGRVVEVGQVPAEVVDCADGTPGEVPAVTAVVRLSQPGGAPDTEVVAVVAVDDALADRLRPDDDSEVALLAGDRVVAASAEPPADLLAQARAAPGRAVTAGGRVAVLEAPGPGRPLGVLVVQPLRDGVQLLRTAAVVVVAAALLAAALALWLARATVRPLEELAEAAGRVAAGDLDTTIEVRSSDEVGRLGGAFNTMTEELRAHVGALQASRDELRAGLARLGQTLISTHDLDRILAVVLETAMASTTARSGAVLLREADGGALVVAAARGLADGGPQRVALGTGPIGQAARDGAVRHEQVADGDAAALDPSSSRVLAVPMRGEDGVLGVLALHDPRSERPGDDLDLVSLRTLADQAAVAVENVLRHRDVSRMAVTDALTGLDNYRSFTDTISREVERATRFDRPLGLLLLDIDHFKHVNDTHGHQRGDAVLVELARRVVDQVRDVDTVARYGGEELVVVLPETGVRGAERAAERIRAAVAAQPFGEAPDVPVLVTVSLGVAVHGVHATTASGLLRRADDALYEAKAAGRNAVRTAREPEPAGGAAPVRH